MIRTQTAALLGLTSLTAHAERLRTQLAAPGFQAWLSVGLALISLGLALIGPRWWERVLWGLFCVTSVWQLWIAWREWKAGSD